MGLSKNAAGWTIPTPTMSGAQKSLLVYISDSGDDATGQTYYADDAAIGSDPRNPVGPILPYKTLNWTNVWKVRDGYPDWLLFNCGDTFSGAMPDFRRSGYSGDERLVITSYSTGGRPIIKHGTNMGMAWQRGEDNFAVIGIEFYASTRDPDSADYTSTNGSANISYLNGGAAGGNMLVEDCCTRFGTTGVVFQCSTGNVDNVEIRRNAIVDTYGAAGGHAQGIYITGLSDLLVDGNVFDICGWYGDRNTGGAAGSDGVATLYNHCMYIDNENPDLVNTGDLRGKFIVRNNIVSNGSSMGIYLRPGGTVENNLVLDTAICIVLGSGDGYATKTPNGMDADARDNVILNSVDITTAFPRGNMFYLQNCRNAYLLGNLMAHMSTTTGWDVADDDPNWYVEARGNVSFDVSNHSAAVADVNTDNEWDTATPGAGNVDSNGVSYLDSTRDAGSYNAILGGTDSNAAFMAQCRLQSRENWDSSYTASAANEWIRNGYNMATARGSAPVILAALL